MNIKLRYKTTQPEPQWAAHLWRIHMIPSWVCTFTLLNYSLLAPAGPACEFFLYQSITVFQVEDSGHRRSLPGLNFPRTTVTLGANSPSFLWGFVAVVDYLWLGWAILEKSIYLAVWSLFCSSTDGTVLDVHMVIWDDRGFSRFLGQFFSLIFLLSCLNHLILGFTNSQLITLCNRDGLEHIFLSCLIQL